MRACHRLLLVSSRACHRHNLLPCHREETVLDESGTRATAVQITATADWFARTFYENVFKVCATWNPHPNPNLNPNPNADPNGRCAAT